MKKVKLMWILDGVIVCMGLAIIGIVILFCVGIKPYIVLSGSMEPEIATGSLCFVNENQAYDEIQTGDLIAFELPNKRLVTHRVVSVTEQGLETKGDANDVSDGITTTRENYVGKTIGAVPYVGYMTQFIQTLRGKIVLVTALSCFVLFSWML